MLYQNRPFFRKLLKLKVINQKNIFLNKNKSFKNNKNQKITQHKFKKTNIFIPTSIIFQKSFFKTKSLKINKINLSARALPYSVTKINYLGVQILTNTVLGNSINLIWKSCKIYNHYINYIYGMKFQLNSLNILSNIITSYSNKQIGLLSSVTGYINSDCLLVVKFAKKEITFITSTFNLGIPSKERTNHMAITSRVRSIAKNPIDHPNGGRASTKGSFKTPWGSIAKHNK
jgi:hypothetical protein